MRASVMLTDFRLLHLTFDQHKFKNRFAEDGFFTVDEAQLALDIYTKGGKQRQAKRKWSNLTEQRLPTNTLRILLGLALVNESQELFDQVVRALGPEKIKPFSDTYGEKGSNPEIR